jgi:hypothetical protein
MMPVWEVLHDEIGDVDDVRHPFLEIGVGHLLEHGLDLIDDGLERPLGVHAFLLDGFDRAAVEQLVVQQYHVGLENVGLLQLCGAVFDDGPQVLLGILDRRFEALDLVFDFFFGDGIPVDHVHASAVDEIGLADADARGGTDAL